MSNNGANNKRNRKLANEAKTCELSEEDFKEKVTEFVENANQTEEIETIESEIYLYEGKPETTVYLSNPKLNEGEAYFAYANLSLDKRNRLWINIEIEHKEGFETINGNQREALTELSKWLKARL